MEFLFQYFAIGKRFDVETSDLHGNIRLSAAKLDIGLNLKFKSG